MPRDNKLLVRLMDAENDAFTRALLPGEAPAEGARRLILEAARQRELREVIIRAAACVVAALSADLEFEQALDAVRQYVGPLAPEPLASEGGA